jgi:hypothetical protein
MLGDNGIVSSKGGLSRATQMLLLLAAVWAGIQFVLSFFLRVTSRGHPSGSGWIVPPGRTYFQTFGVSEVVLTLVVLSLTALVGLALRRRTARGEQGAGGVAWVLSALAALLGVLGFAYVFGVGVCLLIACATMPRQRSPAPGAVRSRSAATAH